MARKSDGEKIDELIPVVSALTERLNNVRDELRELKREIEEARKRLWLIVPPLVAALLSAALMALVNYLSRH